jgi:tetratricopeptide (TPR) repeat protein
MDANSPRGKALTLELSAPDADAAPATGSASSANAKPQRDLRITTADEFLAAAAKEYQQGRVDPALWRRAADQCADDASLVIAAYLRARATALHQKQDEYLQRQTRRVSPVRGAGDRNLEPAPRLEIVSTEVAGSHPLGVQPKLKYLAAVAAALAFVVAVVWLIVSPQESEPVPQPIVSAAAPSPNRSAPPIPLGSEQALVKSASSDTNPGAQNPALETTVQQLKNEGKWNLLVLYASEWTRKDPNNAAAWYALSVGYVNMRQLEEAFDAATKAVQLSPGNALFWRNLGHVNLAVDRLPEAGIAFDKALAVNSDDVDALCGAALIAQRQGRPKDADAIAKRLKSIDASCPRVSDVESVVVVVGGTAAGKPGSVVGR